MKNYINPSIVLILGLTACKAPVHGGKKAPVIGGTVGAVGYVALTGGVAALLHYKHQKAVADKTKSKAVEGKAEQTDQLVKNDESAEIVKNGKASSDQNNPKFRPNQVVEFEEKNGRIIG
jgi:hypothetical protein